MKKKGKFEIEIEDKEGSNLGLWISMGVMIGTAVGSMLSFSFDNMSFLAGGSVVGLLLGTIIGSIAGGDDEDDEEQQQPKKETNKK